MKKFIIQNFIFAICVFTNFVYADFLVNEEPCTMSRDFIGVTSENEEFDGIIKVYLSQGSPSFPSISLSFSRNISPAELNLSWPEPQLLDSSERPIFESLFQNRVAEEKNKTFEFHKEGRVFHSKAYGFNRFQHFIALLLSQNDINLNFVNENSSTLEKIKISLSGSDLAFRQMAYQCNPNLVVNYINSDFSRKKPIYESWTNGYGTTEFYVYEDLLPDEVKFPNDISKFLDSSSLKSYVTLGEIYILLKQKSELNQKIEDIINRADFKTFQGTIEDSANNVLALNKNRELLANSSGGQISQLDLELTDLKLKMETNQAEITAYEKELNPFAEQVELLKIKIDELKGQLQIFEEQIKQTISSNEAYENDLKSLTDILAKYVAEYREEDLLIDQEKVLAVPYSMESIKESETVIEEKLRSRRNLNRILELIESIQKFVDAILIDHKKAIEIFNSLSELKTQKVNATESMNRLDLERAELLQILGGISWETIAEYITKDSENSAYKDQNIKVIKKLFLDSLRNTYSEHDIYIDQLKINTNTILPLIICKSEYFLRSYQGQCLNPNDINDSKKIEIFLDQLDSTKISELAFLTIGKQSRIQKFEKTLNIIIMEKLIEEVKAESQQKILVNWQKALFERWRYSAVRSLNDESAFDISILNNILELQMKTYQEIESSKLQQSNIVKDLDLQIANNSQDYSKYEQAYFASLNLNQNNILNQLRLSDVDLAEINLKCLLDITNITDCADNIKNLVQSSNSSLQNLNQEIKQSVVVLVILAQNKAAQLEDNLTKSRSKLDEILSSKSSFMLQSNFETEDLRYRGLDTELKRKIAYRDFLLEEYKLAEQRILQAEVEKSVINVELESLEIEIEKLVAEMQPTLEQLKPICAEKLKFISELYTIESKILQLFSLQQQPKVFNSICEIKY